MRIRFAAALLCTLMERTAVAGPSEPVLTAGDLRQLCTASDTTSKNVCRVYILGVTQGISIGLNIAAGKASSRRPCIPDQLSGESLAESVKTKLNQVLETSPKERGLDASVFVATVMAKTYACPKAK